MGTYEKSSNNNNLINLVIGLSLLAFVFTLGLFVLKILVALAPLMGVVAVILGGVWYLQAEDEHHKTASATTCLRWDCGCCSIWRNILARSCPVGYAYPKKG